MNTAYITFTSTIPVLVSMGFTIWGKMTFICPCADSIHKLAYCSERWELMSGHNWLRSAFCGYACTSEHSFTYPDLCHKTLILGHLKRVLIEPELCQGLDQDLGAPGLLLRIILDGLLEADPWWHTRSSSYTPSTGVHTPMMQAQGGILVLGGAALVGVPSFCTSIRTGMPVEKRFSPH